MLAIAPDYASATAAALDPARVLVGMGRTPDPWQQAALRSRAKRQAFLAARQVGKGETMTAKGLHSAAFQPGAVVGIVTPTLRQSCRLLRRIRRALPATPHVHATNSASTLLTLSNGSEVHAWPGSRPDLIRGDTLDLLLVDEAAWVPTEAFTATLPMLAMTDGTAIMASTPGGPSGFMFDQFKAEAPDWDLIRVTADQCPRYTPEALALLRRTLGENAYAVEMECQWRAAEDALFSADELARILGTDRVVDQLPGEAPLPDDEAYFDQPQSRHTFAGSDGLWVPLGLDGI